MERAVAAASPYGQGGKKPTWTSVGEFWAFVRPLRAGEVVRAAQPGMETAYVVSMRYNADVTPDCRLLWEGKTLHIVGVTDVDGRHVETEVLCNEREATGGA